MQIPEKGRSRDEILRALESFKAGDMSWKTGSVWAYVYDPGPETARVVQEAYLMYLSENCLDPTVFPSIVRLETDIVRMVAGLLRGDENVVGSATSGGTESIILAVKTARDWARHLRPQVSAPEIVLPQTAHAAFHKAAHLLGLKTVVTPFDPHTFRADVGAMREAISENTILLAASAPCYSQGVIDPIEEIAVLAQEAGLLFHVDACVGGLHLSFMRQMGYPLPDFDFSVPGVTSISADLHKYGYAAKGSSLVLYRDKSLRRWQIFASTATTGYTLINPTLLSSKSAGPLAGAWAILNFLGQEGYHRIVEEVQAATGRLIRGIGEIEGLRVMGEPDMCMFSIASDELNVYQLADEMKVRGWYLQGQFATPLSPPNLHVSVSYGTCGRVEAMLGDLRESVQAVRAAQPLPVELLRGMVAQAGGAGPEELEGLKAGLGLKGTELPQELALINQVLDLLPDEAASELLVDYFNDLFS
jgi:sphinganine-1-phosphate aldolase